MSDDEVCLFLVVRLVENMGCWLQAVFGVVWALDMGDIRVVFCCMNMLRELAA